MGYRIKKKIHITCIACPQGCMVEITKKGGNDYEVSGNKCKRGKEYAINELTNPTRILTSTVKTVFNDFPRLPVKTDREIPLDDVFKYMSEINKILVEKRLHPGDTVYENLLGNNVKLLATADMTVFEA